MILALAQRRYCSENRLTRWAADSIFIGGGVRTAHGKLLAKSETAGNTTADWSDRGSFATSVRSSDDFASSIVFAEDPDSYG